MANVVTCIRILCGCTLLFFPVFSIPFYVLYIIAGFTDMIDGTIARQTNTVSEFGSKLDTFADFVLVLVCLIKILPGLNIQFWMFSWILIVTIIKGINIISGYVVQKRFVAVHSTMNKITGFLLFILPLTLKCIDLRYSFIFVCIAATFAAVQEGHYIRTGRCIE